MNGKYRDEKALVDEILSGERAAFTYFIERYTRLVSHIICRMIDNPADREDVCQEVFIHAYNSLHRFKFQSQLSTWISRIAVNITINYLRNNNSKYLETIPADDDECSSCFIDNYSPETYTEHNESNAQIEQAIVKLPRHFRLIIILYHLDNMSYRQIGEILNLPEGTVKSHLFRARKLLKTMLLRTYQSEHTWK